MSGSSSDGSYAERLLEFIAGLPEPARPRVVAHLETPDVAVLGFLRGWQGAQPIRVVDGQELEVLFSQIPDRTILERAQSEIGMPVRAAIVDPHHPELFDGIVAAAIAARGAADGWVQRVLDAAFELDASDLRLGVGDHPIVKISGTGNQRLTMFEPVTSEQILQAASWAASRDLSAASGPLDIDASAEHGCRRMRANVYRERGNLAVSLRIIPEHPPAFPTLGLPDAVAGFTGFRNGLVLVTGVTGSGKSTTLASLVDMINDREPLAIQTIEDPIEYVHRAKKASIHQREVGRDTASFESGLKSALRQNPDVILVGEIRDFGEIATAIRAAETGHLVFATLHTSSAAATVTRIIDAFPAEQQNQIRVQLASALRAVCCQQLFERIDQPGKAAVVCEIMVVDDPIASLIKRGATQQILSHILDGRGQGMQCMDDALADAVVAGTIADSDAQGYVTRPDTYQARLQHMRRSAR
jgi:twitching motility protein PilT